MRFTTKLVGPSEDTLVPRIWMGAIAAVIALELARAAGLDGFRIWSAFVAFIGLIATITGEA